MLKSFNYILFFGCLIALIVGRILVAGKGYLDDTDEWPYIMLLIFYDELVCLNNSAWSNMVTHSDWSYIETSMRLFQTYFIKWYAHKKELPLLAPQVLTLIGYFNILIYTIISIVYYKILRRLNYSVESSIVGMVVLSSLVNFNLYTRHILPYGTSLLFMLVAFFILLKQKIHKTDVLKIGLFAGLSCFAYVGHFMSIFMVYFALILLSTQSIRQLAINTIYFSIPLITMLLFMETSTRLAGTSYILHNLEFAKEINQGSSEEGLIYVFKYFHEVEGWYGIFLIVVSIVSCFFMIKKPDKRVFAFFTSGITGYLLYGSYVYFTENFVFYGRILHLFVPFLIFGVIYFSHILKNFKIAYPIILIAFVNFAFTIKNLNNIDYPRSIAHETETNLNATNLFFVNEGECFETYNHQSIFTNFYRNKSIHADSLIAVNWCFFNHSSEHLSFKEFTPPPNSKLIFEKKHFMSHPAYLYEYCTIEERQFFLENDFKIKLYKVL